MNTAILGMLNGWEIVLILAVVLVLFGARKLPELARGLGQGIKEFKKATRDVTDELQNAIDSEPPPPPSTAKKLPEPDNSTTASTVPQSTSENKA
jgi:sec-independent protein translocase protein TatA